MDGQRNTGTHRWPQLDFQLLVGPTYNEQGLHLFCDHVRQIMLIYVLLAINVLSCVSCPVYLSGRLVHCNLSRLSCPSCSVPDVLSKMSCSDPSVLYQLSCSSCPAQATLPIALLMPLSCPGSPVISVHSSLLVQANISRLSCPVGPVPSVPSV
jgi:hypothetical protein